MYEGLRQRLFRSNQAGGHGGTQIQDGLISSSATQPPNQTASLNSVMIENALTNSN